MRQSDIASALLQVTSWFEENVSAPGKLRGLSIQLKLVRVTNEIQKPGPVFTATTKVLFTYVIILPKSPNQMENQNQN